MIKKLHIDIETYSSIDIMTSGSYRYMESIDFEILMIAYAYDDGPIQIVDLALGEVIPDKFLDVLHNHNVEKHAHNANFERIAFKTIGHNIPIDQWRCTAVKAASCGLPISLGAVSTALNFTDKAKMATGKALIRFFCIPIKPTKKNGFAKRYFPEDDMEKWEQFKEYCIGDVEAERAIDDTLEMYEVHEFERVNYIIDQKINDVGIKVDRDMAQNAYDIDTRFSQEIKNKVKEITGLENPNSPKQLKDWLSDKLQKEVKTLAKDGIDDLIEEAGLGPVSDVLNYRKKLAKSSTKKYLAMLNCYCEDGRVHGLFQFYGASRTGRWAGRLVQLQNLPQNHLEDLKDTRDVIASGDYDLATLMFDDISSILSQLIRTAFVAKENHTFAVADFSAIEARVLSWLASEKWREDVFHSHGKIYEASASAMFNVPIEEVTKASDYRAKGKNAELALGYQGAVGAMRRMARGTMDHVSDKEMKSIVNKWRRTNPKIVELWNDFNNCAVQCVRTKSKVISDFKGIEFDCDDNVMTIKLPSGRKLAYWGPKLGVNSFRSVCVEYKGVDQVTKQWIHIDTYGGKLVENVVQAISRDILAYSMMRLDDEGYCITMHVHDEAICEVPIGEQKYHLKNMCKIMGEDIPWAEGLPLDADGYLTPFYKKD